MVGFHVVDDEVVDGTITDDGPDVFQVLGEEVNLHRVYQTHLLIVYQV